MSEVTRARARQVELYCRFNGSLPVWRVWGTAPPDGNYYQCSGLSTKDYTCPRPPAEGWEVGPRDIGDHPPPVSQL
jgi:hypothetical protein